MAQQAVRKFRRGAGKPGAFWRGLAVSVLATAAAVIVFALIISFVDMSDGVIQAVNQLIKASAVFQQHMQGMVTSSILGKEYACLTG